jgi:hypothetical protein
VSPASRKAWIISGAKSATLGLPKRRSRSPMLWARVGRFGRHNLHNLRDEPSSRAVIALRARPSLRRCSRPTAGRRGSRRDCEVSSAQPSVLPISIDLSGR